MFKKDYHNHGTNERKTHFIPCQRLVNRET